VDTLIAAPEFRNAHWGGLIVDPESGDTLYSHNAGKLFMPASNQKIVTGAVALATLGADFRFRTTLVASRPVEGGVHEGDIVVHGRGDPSFSDAMRGDAMAPMRELADSVAARGLGAIRGRVLPGDDVFPGAPYGYGWSWDELAEPYSAGVDELLFNEGFSRIVVRATTSPPAVTAATAPATLVPALRTDGLRVAPAGGGATSVEVERDSASGGYRLRGQVAPGDTAALRVAYPDQRTAFLLAFRQALRERGITLDSGAVRQPPESGGRADTIAVYHSPPLREILRAFEKPSQNQIGEVLLRTLGLEVTGVGTPDSGRAVIERQLAAWGAPREGYVVRDGSGLSRYNYLSPETIVRVLAAIRADTAFSAFAESLPVAGVDGTLANRMRGTPAQGNARAKTGFVSQARSLSGYVTTADGRTLIFSLLCNNWTVPVRAVERVQDAIVAHLAATSLTTAAR
jgi:D-alanyl-D-alanine carboxypeptidase/D-alanyl-D-alanine-endopeptidase (penicillin-binding protein 4)